MSITIDKYKEKMRRCILMYHPQLNDNDIDQILNFSIKKRFQDHPAKIENNYVKGEANMTLLELADYINSREPIVTAHGTMFRKHGEVPNPLARVIQSFLDERAVYKKKMFTYPKGTEEFEKYNLLQQLSKIDANAIYGTLGMYMSLIYNENVASSITSQGRALVSSAGMVFEMFLANNVKFGSLNEVVNFIDNIVQEKYERKYKDRNLLDKDISVEDCFAKVILTCGYCWVPDKDDMEIIWKMLNNLDQEDINRIYYKNNLFEFMSNKSMIKAVRYILSKMTRPYLTPADVPDEILPELTEFSEILLEYVYYHYQIIDRTSRMDKMYKSVCLISDTDSTFISMDGWYRFILSYVRDMDLNILHQSVDAIRFMELDDFGDIKDSKWKRCITIEEPELDFDFMSDEVIEVQRQINPLKIIPQDNLRFSIINILAFVIDKVINDYMVRFTKNNHSWSADKPCKIIMKNEFLLKRALLTSVKKSYASIQELQEGNKIPQTQKASLDIKGIAAMAKSSMATSTRDALKKIMYEDILKSEEIDQLQVLKHLAILEKKIVNSLYAGSKEFYKPLKVKSMSRYADPMRQQGIKASIVWNAIKDPECEPLNLDERNSVDVAKIKVNTNSIESLKTKNPELYDRCKIFLENNKEFKGSADAIAIPINQKIPDWLLDILDYDSIVNDNLKGFPVESINIRRLNNQSVNYTNILKL